MKLTIRNVGKFINENSVEINGITVLAGANGSGKSTIGKMLFCLFDAFYNYSEETGKERARLLNNILRSYDLINFRGDDYFPRIRMEQIKELLKLSGEEDVKLAIDKWVNKNIVRNDEDDSNISEVKKKLENVLQLDKHAILTSLLQKRFSGEFKNEIRHVNNLKTPSSIILEVNNKKVNIEIGSNGKVSILSDVELVKDAVYLDDPNALDLLQNYGPITPDFDIMYSLYFGYSHNSKLLRVLDYRYKSRFSNLASVMQDDGNEKIQKLLSDANVGDVTFSKESGYRYKDAALNDTLDIANVSMGLKSYLIIKQLLAKGVIEEKCVLILDEPEIHLHPEWMRIYAEIVVLLQKYYSLSIVISTHSPDFLNFIELYSDKHEIKDKCKYYLLKNFDNIYSEICDVSDNIDVIYRMLGEPLIQANEELNKNNES